MNILLQRYYRHEKTGGIYKVLALVQKIKLFGRWWNLDLVVYTPIPEGIVYARKRASFEAGFKLDNTSFVTKGLP